MKLVTQTPKKALKAFLKQKPLRSEIDIFKKNLIALLDKISVIEKRPKDETEEHLKNDLRDFLRDTYYRDTNAINTKDKKDLVIHLDKTTNSEVGVIIEAKRPNNIGEMITADNPNKKALHELILYYLDERNKVGNFQLKQLVITNINEWYIIDANHFDKHIYNNTQIKNLYKTKVNDNKNNPFFYQEIEKLISKIDVEIPCVYFDIRNYDTILRNKKENDRELSALLKILSPQHLLKIVTPNDSNALDEKFYKELLHIMGLEEAKEYGKNIIRRKKESREAASLIEATIEALKTEDVLHRLSDQSIYGSTKDERIFNIALELCITWINRILFLKLLEGQLINYHQGNIEYRFLNIETINDFGELFKLFHQVLVVTHSERIEAIKTKYGKVPYLNSSLFEISDLEDQTININSLDNGGKLELIDTTILKEIKRKAARLTTLDYLFKFLDAYDFASEGTEDVQEDNKTIINASVLGKVFEKINGYKDGSFFTPALITMYMCKQSIRLAVVEKFNKALSGKEKTQFDKFEDVKNYTSRLYKTQEILKANEIINSLRICDPAVGSGHFLVSSLNEIISIKAELKILADKGGNIISGYEIEIVNDELIITDQQTNIFEYKLQNGKPLNKEIQRLQKVLFYEKKNIIENCLFGVDINPNSVKICRLRLWIELLKNAFYKEETNFSELETLPNIDINIKCGNSLLSRFPLDADLSKALKRISYDVEAYSGFVNDYKNEKSRDVKKGLQKIIDTIKTDFRTEIGKNDPKQLKLIKLKGVYSLLNQDQIFELTPKEEKAIKEKKTKLKVEIDKLIIEIKEIKNNTIYKNAFEWRFEFPEVLSNDGVFQGFDIVIGNPPYVSTKNINDADKKAFLQLYGFADDLYYHFIIKGFELLKPNGINAMITPDTYFTTLTKKQLRNKLTSNKLCSLLHLGHDVFEEAMVSTTIFIAQKNEVTQNETIVIDARGKKELSEAKYYTIPQSLYTNSINGSFFIPNETNLKIHNKLATKHKALIDTYWNSICTSRGIEKNKIFLNKYRKNLKEGDYTLVGLVTEGGQGLATANNGKFVGIKEGTKEADRIRETRINKLQEANQELGTKYKMPPIESEIVALFDEIKLQHGRDIFGQGYLYRIVPLKNIADINTLSTIEKTNGIATNKPTFVPYDKGDKDGNRWYLPTPYYIDWCVENVSFLKSNTGKKGVGMPVVRNPQFYFREGFCWIDVNSVYLKCRLKSKSVHDVLSMSLFSMTEKIPEFYIITIINSSFISEFVQSFLNATSHFQINDCRALPIPVPTKNQLAICKKLFDEAVILQQDFFAEKISVAQRDKQLLIVQNKVDDFVSGLYNL